MKSSTLFLDYQIDNFFSLFNINTKNGLICLNDFVNYQNLLLSLIKSPFRYFDKYNKLCYNLLLFASKRPLTPIDLSKLVYSENNCSFNYLKICLNDFNSDYNPPLFNNQTCEAGIYLKFNSNMLKKLQKQFDSLNSMVFR